MERRTFLQILGGLGASSLARGNSSWGASGERGNPPASRDLLAQRNQNRSTVISQHGMVCASQPLASMAGIDDEVKLKLAHMGHCVRPNTGAWGGYQGIWWQDDPLRYFGGSDPRKDGCAIGF